MTLVTVTDTSHLTQKVNSPQDVEKEVFKNLQVFRDLPLPTQSHVQYCMKTIAWQYLGETKDEQHITWSQQMRAVLS